MKRTILIAALIVAPSFVIVGTAIAGLEESPARQEDRLTPLDRAHLGIRQAQADGAAAGARARDQYHGTQILPHQDAEGRILKFQQDITSLFARQGAPPPQRLEHFQWLDRPGIGLRGWRGQIRQVIRSDHGWLVTINVSPRIVSDKAAEAHTPDYYLETYEYSFTGLKFIGGVDPPDAMRIISYN